MANVNPKLDLLKASILNHNNDVFLPSTKTKFVKYKTDSCFTINVHTDKKQIIKDIKFIDSEETENKDLISAKPIDLFFKGKEKNIIDKWLNCCIETTNITVDFFQNLMKDRIFLIHRKNALLFIKNNVLKEIHVITSTLKKETHNANLCSKLKHLNKTVSNIDEKIIMNNKKLLDAIKNEQIYWLTNSITNIEKKDVYVQSTIDEHKSLDYWKKLNEKDIKSYKLHNLLKYFKDLKEKLLKPNYFQENQEQINNLLLELETYKLVKKGNKNKFANNKINKEMKKINDKINKIKYEHIPHFTFKNVRSILHVKLTDIINRSQTGNNKKTQIKKHILDESVKQVCIDINSMLKNYANKNIKSFKLRKRKMNKHSKNMILEKEFFSKGSIFKKLFEDMKCEKNGKPYNIFDVFSKKTSCNLVHNDITNTYKLYVPEKVIKKETKKETKNNKSFGGDFGIRTFLTGISENEIIEIGRSSEMEIKNMVLKVRDLKNPNTKIKNKQKKIRKLRKDIANKVDELHWKTIKFITNNYKTVVVGDINIKSIVRKEGNLSDINKDLIHALSIYKFKQRLKYKCKCMGLKCHMPDEYGTSKLCSCCGNYNNVEGSKIYECKTCKSKIDRDVNSARSIMMLRIK